jgi:NAD(P)-dependent dehydrogenase (short-subunit alcohol dehydrogenase family)
MTQINDSLNGKICMVTGATAGIGKITAVELARMGAEVLIVGRNPDKCAATIDFIRAETGNHKIVSFVADLSSQAALRKLAESFRLSYSRLDVLVNNAGVMNLRREETEDGIEMTWAINHLAYFLLTNLLLPELTASPKSRIVTVASNAHVGKTLHFDDLEYRRGYQFMKVYGQSKLANVMFTYALARRLAVTPVTANVLHPGFVNTNMGKNNGFFVRLLYPLVTRNAIPTAEGAETSIYLASSPEVEGVTGQYFVRKKAMNSDPVSYDQEVQERLWKISAEMTGL